MITLYGLASPNVFKIQLALEELGLKYDFAYVDVNKSQQFSPEFLALNPNNKVPVIVDEDGPDGEPYTVFESGAILLYLAEKTGKLMPEGMAARHEAIQWLMLQMAGAGPAFGQLTHFMFLAPEQFPYSVSRYRTESDRIYRVFDRRLAEREWLAGDDYSIADIAMYAWASIYHERHGFNWSDHPHVKRWCDAIAERPSAQRARRAYQGLKEESVENMTDDSRDRIFGWGKYAVG